MEIRFRVWDGEKMWYPKEIASKRPIYGLEEWYLGISGRLCSVSHSYDGAEVDYFPNHSIMLSTGLKDTNGKEIWDGDICRVNIHHRADAYLVSWNDVIGAFAFYQGGSFRSGTWWYDADYEVMGNRYENPELLEGVAK